MVYDGHRHRVYLTVSDFVRHLVVENQEEALDTPRDISQVKRKGTEKERR